jgi:hypothetical protein
MVGGAQGERVGRELDAAPAPVQGVPCQGRTWNGSITGLLRAAPRPATDLNPMNPSIATTSIPSRQAHGRTASHSLQTCLERPWTMPSSRPGPVPSPTGGEVDDHGDVPVAPAGVPPDVLVDANGLHSIESRRVLDQEQAPLGQDRGRVPCNGKAGGDPGDPGDAQVLADDALQCPEQAGAGELRPGLRGQARVMPPHVAASGAPVAADADFQHCQAPAQPLVSQTPENCVPGGRTGTRSAAPFIRGHDTASQHRLAGIETLPNYVQAEPIEPGERLQVRRQEGAVGHVEVFRMVGVGTSIIGRPRPLSSHRLAHPYYTLNYDEAP